MAEVDYSRDTGKSNANSTASSAADSFADLNSAAAKNDAILEKNNVEFDKTPYQEKLNELKQRYETNTAFQKDMRKLKADSKAKPKQGVDPATDKFQKDQTVISSLLEHYGKPGEDKNARFDSNSIKNISELVKHNGPVNVLSDAQKQVQAEKRSDRTRIEAFQELLDSDPKKDEKFTDKLANANQLLKNPAKLSEKQQTALDYNPNIAGAAYVEKVNAANKGKQAAPTNASAASNASASTESNSQQSTQSSDKQSGLDDKKVSNSKYYDVKLDIFNNPSKSTLGSDIRATYYNNVNDYRRQVNSNNTAYAERDMKLGKSGRRLENYENDLMRASQIHQNDVESGSKDTDNSKYYVASILAKGPGSKKPSDEKIQQQLQKLDKHGFKNVVGNELKRADTTLDKQFLRRLALNAELSKKRPTQEDKELASAAMEPGYRPTYGQAASQAQLVGVPADYAGKLAYEAVARDAESKRSSQQTSTSAAVQSDTQNSSAASKTSKAAHEASETATSNEASNNSSNAPSVNGYVYKLSPKEVGLSSNSINTAEIENAKNKAGKSTQNAAFEKSGEKDVANKEFNEEASNQAADTAADVHMNTNEKLAKENAELAKKLKDKEQRKELENENERLRSELGMPSRKKGFINKLKTAWNKIQGVDKNKDSEKLANGEKAGAGHMLMRFGKKSLFAACLLVGGTLSVGKQAFKSAGKHIMSAMDKGAVRGFAPGDVHAPGSANKSQDLER